MNTPATLVQGTLVERGVIAGAPGPPRTEFLVHLGTSMGHRGHLRGLVQPW